MFVFLIGSHGTGKTTVLKEIERQTGKPCIDGMNRVITRANLTIDDYDSQSLLIDLTIHVQSQFINYKDVVYFTRSMIDQLAYANVNLKVDFEKGCMDFLNNIKKNSVFFYFPIEFPISKDAERSDDIKYQKKVDKEMRKIIEKHEIMVHRVTGTVEERVKFILDIVDRYNWNCYA